MIEATKALVQYFEEETEKKADIVLKTAKNYAKECQKQMIAEINSIDDIFR